MSEPAHAVLSPSKADRWAVCPGSMSFPDPQTSSSFADEGTAMHVVGAEILDEGLVVGEYRAASSYIGQRIDIGHATVSFTQDMADTVQRYVDYVVNALGPNDDLLIEQKFDLTRWVPESFGTADAVILHADGELHVIDFKGGRGVEVEAEGNRQMSLYALGAFQKCRAFDLNPVRTRMTIVQPRVGPPKEWDCSVDELLAIGEELKEAAERAYLFVGSETPVTLSDLQPSEKGCRFCPARASGACPALTAEVASMTGADFDDLTQTELPTPGILHSLSAQMAKVELIEQWCKGVRAAVEHALFQGDPVEGYKLVAGRKGARSWEDEEDAEKTLKSMRLKQEHMYDFKLISPTTAEKLVKSGVLSPARWKKLQEMIVAREGSPSVAPESDKRPALVIPKAADFENLEQEDDLA